MSFTIAVAGKGGTGKTSITALIIRYLKNQAKGTILAVDADPNANLGDSLGLSVRETIGSIIASFNKDKIKIPPGMTKEAYLEYKLNENIVESREFDLITMGRGEGPDCYCYPNTVLRKFIDRLSQNYSYVIMDNEAGMEHLSRRTTENVDALLLVSDHSVKGVRTVARIRDLISELGLVVKRQMVIINLVPDKLAPMVTEELARQETQPAAIIPWDEEVYQYDLGLKPMLDLPDNSGAVKAIDDLMAELLHPDEVQTKGG